MNISKSVQAKVNYHVQKAERQAFVIDAEGVSGALVSPELVERAITLHDARALANPLCFDDDGLLFVRHPLDTAWRNSLANPSKAYDEALENLLKSKLGAVEVVVFDHTARTDDAGAERRPARHVHSDYSRDGALKRVVEILGEERSKKWRHFAFVNVWRPMGEVVRTAPLAFVHPASVDKEDWLSIGLDYADRQGEIMGLSYNPNHRWLYCSFMSPEEVAIFNIFDSGGISGTPHSAVDIVGGEQGLVRHSLESRTLVRYR